MQLTDQETISKNADRVLTRVSPSQVESFNLCNRRWYNENIRGMREAMTPAAQRGVDIADEVENYFKTGALRPDAKFKEMVEVVLPLLGPSRPTVTVEEWVESPTFEGGPVLRGRYDHLDVGKEVRIFGTEPMEMLSDVKSRSDLRYAKTPEELAEDLQLNAYARPVAIALGLDQIALRHAYTRTRKGPPKGLAVTTIVDRAQLDRVYEKTVNSVRQMVHWATLRPATADPLPPNTEACKKFPPHGCPHRALCGFDSSSDNVFQIRRTEMSETNGSSSLLDRLKAQQAALMNKGPAPVVETPAAAPAPVEAVPVKVTPIAAAPKNGSGDPVARAKAQLTSGEIRYDSGADQIYAKEGADSGWLVREPTMFERIALDEVNKAPVKSEPPAPPMGTHAEFGFVVPPDAPPRTNQPGDEVAAAPKTRKKKEKGVTVSVDGAPAVPVEELAGPAERAQAKFDASRAPVAGTTTTATAPVTTTPALSVKGPVLFIDMICTKGSQKGLGTPFEEWLNPIAEELAQEKGVADWRIIQYTAKGDLAAKIRQYASTLPPLVMVSRFSPAADVFLEQVIPLASDIYQKLG